MVPPQASDPRAPPLPLPQWQDNRTEMEDRKRYDQANRDREYDDAMAAFASPSGTPKKKKQRRDKGTGFG